MRTRAAGLLALDSHARFSGGYTVRSLYLDDFRDSCLWDNLNGNDPRTKYRIRYYNSDTSYLSLEKKSKVRGMTHKESCPISRADCARFLQGDALLWTAQTKTSPQLFYEVTALALRPAVIVTYDRIPFVYPGGNVRITFDRCITSSDETNAFLEGTYRQHPVLPPDTSILEVKWDELLPPYIGEALSLDTLQWAKFSKYATCRTAVI